MGWIIGIALGVAIGYFLDREIYFYEGVHLGPRVQAWLYDRWAKKYDAGKRASQLRDAEMLARPLLESLNGIPQPFILDFATGTGRLSFALLNQADFNGHIVALDLSQGMLEQAVEKIAGLDTSRESHAGHATTDAVSGTIEFIRHLALPLPFPDGMFDAVCALEVLELFPSMDEPLAELARVLRPGGILLTTRGTEESGRKAKVKSRDAFASLLQAHGLRDVQIVTWWKFFDRVLAKKHGESQPMGAKRLEAVLRCKACGQTQWGREAGAWMCRRCANALSVTAEGIVLN